MKDKLAEFFPETRDASVLHQQKCIHKSQRVFFVMYMTVAHCGFRVSWPPSLLLPHPYSYFDYIQKMWQGRSGNVQKRYKRRESERCYHEKMADANPTKSSQYVLL